ncbi:MAG: hypothetical protein ACTSRP_04215 [Candidatus Helarchaeota archaeon]
MSDENIIDYVRLTRVWDSFKAKEIRVSSEAKPKIIEILNKVVDKKIKEIIDKLPKYTKGANVGALKRKTIKLEDLEGL